MRRVKEDIGALETRLYYVEETYSNNSVGQDVVTGSVETVLFGTLTYKNTGGSNAERQQGDTIETSFNASEVVVRYGIVDINQRGHFKMSTNLENDTNYQIWDIENISYYPTITRPRYIVCLCRNRT